MCEQAGKVTLNPPWDYKIGPKDEVLVIAEDDDTYKGQSGRRG